MDGFRSKMDLETGFGLDLDMTWLILCVYVCLCVCVCVRDIIGISSLRQAPVIKRRPAISYQGEKPFVPTRWTEAEIKQISRKYQMIPKQIKIDIKSTSFSGLIKCTAEIYFHFIEKEHGVMLIKMHRPRKSFDPLVDPPIQPNKVLHFHPSLSYSALITECTQ